MRLLVTGGAYRVLVWDVTTIHDDSERPKDLATGRAGFVMSSQASSAGRDEAAVRRKLIETGDVDVMIAVRSNFFYTRTVPCELWFLNRD